MQRDVEEGIWENYSPLSTIDYGVAEFKIEGTKRFIDLQNFYFSSKVCIVNADSSNLAADKEVSVVNYLAGYLWKTVSVKLNADPIILCGDYNYRSYLETLLTYSSASNKSWLQCGCYYKDSQSKFNRDSNFEKAISPKADRLKL
jgi:hypothetical protein